MNQRTSQPVITIAIAADLGYETQVITLIKSLCYHHSCLKIYLFHKTYPVEWFDCVNKWLKPLNSEVIPVWVFMDFSEYTTAPHITETTFYRFLIPYLPEDRVLYLDCDMVVNSDLSTLINTPFDGKALIAVEDFVLNNIPHAYPEYPDIKPYFNAGMLVFNNSVWKAQNLVQISLERLKTDSNKMLYADQDVLNSLFCKSWKAVDFVFNFQVDAITDLGVRRNQTFIIEEKGWLSKEAVIIHYTGSFKPWKNNNAELLRDKYWFYYNLTWRDIWEKWI